MPLRAMVAGIDGFGRFTLHLLKYWLDRSDQTPFTIRYLNDPVLSLEEAREILQNDEYVDFSGYRISTEDSCLSIADQAHRKHQLLYSRESDLDAIPWTGKPDFFFECSGRSTVAQNYRPLIRGRTRQVLISATSMDADQTLVYGFNHETWAPRSRVISYGSCTVNCYVPLAAWMHRRYGIVDSDVNVVHNTPRHRRKHTLVRCPCTLEQSGPKLLPFLQPDRFAVNYTIVPYSGVSMLDLRFQIARPVSPGEFVRDLVRATTGGELAGLYQVDPVDVGPEAYVCTRYNAVFIENQIRVRGNNIYLSAYFDNENSASRFYDLASYLSTKLSSSNPKVTPHPAATDRDLHANRP